MKTKLTSLLMLAALAAIAAGAAFARPQAPAQPHPAFRLGTPAYSDAYCVRLARRCDLGDQNACKLYNQGCGL